MTGFDEVFDFVVAGSGAGSMAASLVMRSANKSVVVLEKQPMFGGSTARSGGVMWIPNNRFMAEAGVEDSPERAIAYLDALMGEDPTAPGATHARRLAYVREAPRMVDFLVSQGIRLSRVKLWPDYYDELPGSSKEGRTVVADPFDLAELGEWEKKLFPTVMDLPVHYDKIWDLKCIKVSWAAKLKAVEVGLKQVKDKLTGHHRVAGGGALQGRMLQAALKAGVDIRLNAPVKELVVEDGRVTGVVAEIEGRTRRIGARLGVLVNAGGFSRNQEMRDKYQPGTRVEWSETAPGDTGEMIREMMRIGAAMAQMDEMVGNQVIMPPGIKDHEFRPMVQGTTAAPHAILVDQTGVRYQNEGGDYMGYCKGMLRRNKTHPAVPSWGVWDSQFMKRTMVALEPNPAVVQRWIRDGFIRKADSIEALAGKLDINPETLKATVERFNGFVRKGKDEDFGRGEREYDRWLGDPFHKPSPSLGTVEKAPFYAMPIVPGDVGTYGGAVTDIHARVLREDGTPIPGLYATATSTASVMGRKYAGAGASVGPGFVWGFVAAKHAANLDNQAGSETPAKPAARKRKASA